MAKKGERPFKELTVQGMNKAKVDALRKISEESRTRREEGQAMIGVCPSHANGIDGRTAASLYRGGLLTRQQLGKGKSGPWRYYLTDAGEQMLAHLAKESSTANDSASEETICKNCNEMIPRSEAQTCERCGLDPLGNCCIGDLDHYCVVYQE